jgi:hypothetical protein
MSNKLNDVKVLAAKIENLARDVQKQVDSETDFLPVANELVRNNLTFVFTLGEFYALQQSKNKKNNGALATAGNKTYYNVRDLRGRFVKSV